MTSQAYMTHIFLQNVQLDKIVPQIISFKPVYTDKSLPLKILSFSDNSFISPNVSVHTDKSLPNVSVNLDNSLISPNVPIYNSQTSTYIEKYANQKFFGSCFEERKIESEKKVFPLVYNKLDISKCKIHICSKGCTLKTSYHPQFVDSKISGCSYCEKQEDIVKRICKFRNFNYIEFDNEKKMIKYECDKNVPHECKMTFDDIRRGRGCSKCKKENVKRKCNNLGCDCKKLGLGYYSKNMKFLCKHYNFAILYEELVANWDFILNEVLPDKIFPQEQGEYWFRCKKYGICYEHCLSHRVRSNVICPYCCSKCPRVCNGNSFISTHPKLCEEWDFDENFLYPNEVTQGSDYIASWICKVNPEHIKYRESVNVRTRKNRSGCPRCVNKAYEQRIGGHDHFVKVVSEIHNNKYSYPERYINGASKIGIFCPVISKYTNEQHGLFRQEANSHKKGSGCKKCAEEQTDSKGIIHIKTLLKLLNYNFETEKIFEGLMDKKNLRIDIFLYVTNIDGEKIQIVIEWDGVQHFISVPFWGGEEGLVKSKKRDLIKDKYFVKNGISLLRFADKSLPTLEELNSLIETCKTTQIYKSYDHYISVLEEDIDFSITNIKVIETEF
jgi:hypothetical protein